MSSCTNIFHIPSYVVESCKSALLIENLYISPFAHSPWILKLKIFGCLRFYQHLFIKTLPITMTVTIMITMFTIIIINVVVEYYTLQGCSKLFRVLQKIKIVEQNLQLTLNRFLGQVFSRHVFFRNSYPKVFYKQSILENFANIHSETPLPEPLFN